jgi:hypothetical protein
MKKQLDENLYESRLIWAIGGPEIKKGSSLSDDPWHTHEKTTSIYKK